MQHFYLNFIVLIVFLNLNCYLSVKYSFCEYRIILVLTPEVRLGAGIFVYNNINLFCRLRIILLWVINRLWIIAGHGIYYIYLFINRLYIMCIMCIMCMCHAVCLYLLAYVYYVPMYYIVRVHKDLLNTVFYL